MITALKSMGTNAKKSERLKERVTATSSVGAVGAKSETAMVSYSISDARHSGDGVF